MAIALVTFLDTTDQHTKAILDSLGSAIRTRGFDLVLIDGTSTSSTVAMATFDYIATITRPDSLWRATVPARVEQFWKEAVGIQGKKGCALVIRHGWRTNAFCRKVMAIMESVGICVDYFEIIRDAAHCSDIAPFIG